MIKNKLFLLLGIINYADGMDNPKCIELTIYGVVVKEAHTIDDQILQKSKNKCLALGLGWTDNTIKSLVKISPRYYDKNKKFINCLIHNPRALNQAIIDYHKNHVPNITEAEIMQKLMEPQLPQYVIFDKVPEMYKTKVQWSLYGCTLNVNFIWKNDEREFPVFNPNKSLPDTTEEQKDFNYNAIYTILSNPKIKYIACLGLGTLVYLYMV